MKLERNKWHSHEELKAMAEHNSRQIETNFNQRLNELNDAQREMFMALALEMMDSFEWRVIKTKLELK